MMKLVVLDENNSSQPFPPLRNALCEPNGLLAIGGCLSSERLINAYRQGVFPWFSGNEPILWWSPNPRLVLFPAKLHISKRLAKTLRQKKFDVTTNQAFDLVISKCAELRVNAEGTWISADIQRAYSKLHREGFAHSFEAWHDGELVGGLYFGHKESGINEQGLRYVKETLEYDELQISRILHQAFKLAQKRKKILHNIHKSNVLKSSVLWNEILDEVAVEYPDVEVIHQLVDSAATNLCLRPTQFDVMVMENMFGDILSDQGGGILGSLGLMPSACLGDDKAYYEPSHGSAPDIAGKNIANPYSMIGSVAMMLENSFDMAEEAKNVWAAMQGVFADGYSTADLSKPGTGVKMISTAEFGDKVVEKLSLMPRV